MKKIRATAVYGARIPHNASSDDWRRSATGWTVTLRYDGRRLTVPFWMGPALSHEPTAADVMSCLCSDASGYENAIDIDDWAEYYFSGEVKPSVVIRQYREVEKQTEKLRRFLRDDYEAIVYADDDDVARRCA